LYGGLDEQQGVIDNEETLKEEDCKNQWLMSADGLVESEKKRLVNRIMIRER
jgi:hypothetical protein